VVQHIDAASLWTENIQVEIRMPPAAFRHLFMLNTVHHFQFNCLQAKAEAADLNAALIVLKPGAICTADDAAVL